MDDARAMVEKALAINPNYQDAQRVASKISSWHSALGAGGPGAARRGRGGGAAGRGGVQATAAVDDGGAGGRKAGDTGRGGDAAAGQGGRGEGRRQPS